MMLFQCPHRRKKPIKDTVFEILICATFSATVVALVMHFADFEPLWMAS